MKISINPNVKGKLKDNFNLLGCPWENIECSWEEAFELITVDGFASSAELNNSIRCDANFQSRELIMIDIDDGMSILDLLEDEFYNEYGAGFYATPSYTDDKPKFRICFRSEYPITNSEDYKRIVRSLMTIYKYSDVSCKDAARLYYGTPNCIIKDITNKVIPMDVIDILIKYDKDRESQELLIEKPFYEKRCDSKIIELLCRIPVIDYYEWRTIAWGLKWEGYNIEDFYKVTLNSCGVHGTRTTKEATTIWNKAKNDGKVTLGSVIFILKKHLGKECFSTIHGEY
jgi:hypothetical protein